MSASILRRHIIGGFFSRRFFCSGVDELVRSSATCLLLPPDFDTEAGVMYNYIRFHRVNDVEMGCFLQRGGKEETDLMTDRKTKWVGSSHGWLALFNSRNRDMFLLNPISGRRVELPPCRGQPFMEEELYPLPYKVVLSHSPREEECRAVMILGSLDRAAFCRPGRCSAWTPLGRWYDPDPINKILYGDFVYSASRKSFFGSFRSDSGGREDLGRCNFAEARMELVANAPFAEYDPKSTWMSFVVSDEESGGLFLVRRYLLRGRKVDVDVYRVIVGDGEGEGGRVERCSSLEGLAMFIGKSQSLASKETGPPNTICFSGHWFDADQFMDRFDYVSKICWSRYPAGKKRAYRWPPPWFTFTFD